MATATPQGNMNIENYDEALRLFEEEMYDEAIAAAQHNLGDLSLHWYWQVMNLIFIAQVEDKWNSAEVCFIFEVRVPLWRDERLHCTSLVPAASEPACFIWPSCYDLFLLGERQR